MYVCLSVYVDILLETAGKLVLSWQEIFTGSAGGTKVCSSTALTDYDDDNDE